MFSSGKLLASPSASDPYFNYTSLLLNETDTNGAQNNTFVDGSTNNFTITRNGNVTQGTSAPFGNLWSTYFNGTSNYLSLPASSAYQFGTGDFTIEWWQFLMGTILYPRVFSLGTYSTATIAVSIESGSLYFWELTIPAKRIIAITNYLNKWSHFAISRVSNVTRIFQNGVQIGTDLADSNNLNNAATNFTIGAETTPSVNTYFNGYISNFRVIKGTGLYTTTFTPSTTPLTAVANTVLLTCQSNRHIDNSTNNFAVTPNASPPISKFSPFSLGRSYSTSVDGASGYFDGNGDYLSIPYNTAFDLSTGDWTVELWWYPTTTGLDQNLIMVNFSGSDGYAHARITATTTNKFYILSSTNGVSWLNTTQIGSWTTGQWYHLAYVRSGSTFTLYVNGVSAGSYTSSSTLTNFSGSSEVGRNNVATGVQYQYAYGYISNARVVKGTAVYTSNFTPPTSPLTPISNTSLLLNFSNAGIYNATRINVLETLGNAQVSTAQAKWGSSSIYFDGTGDYLKAVGDSTAFEFRNGDFTIEFFVYLNATQTSVIYDGRPTGVNTTQPTIYVNSNAIRYYSTTDRILGSTISNNTWTHIALTRSGTSTRLFLNGTQTGSTYTDSIIYTNTANRPVIGLDGFSENTQFLNGYIQDLRVTKGIARYTSNFTAPTAPFPTR